MGSGGTMHSRAKIWNITGNGVTFEVVNLKAYINATFPTLNMGGVCAAISRHKQYVLPNGFVVREKKNG
jgi:hypothetical protein